MTISDIRTAFQHTLSFICAFSDAGILKVCPYGNGDGEETREGNNSVEKLHCEEVWFVCFEVCGLRKRFVVYSRGDKTSIQLSRVLRKSGQLDGTWHWRLNFVLHPLPFPGLLIKSKSHTMVNGQAPKRAACAL
jgi:hypothetical protein